MTVTDNEIMQALSWCLTVAKSCGSVTLSKEEMVGLCDLINRQKAEIERLQKENAELGKAIGNAYELNCFLEATRKYVRTEAYREFAERLKSYLLLNLIKDMSVVTADDIDKISEELTRNSHGTCTESNE